MEKSEKCRERSGEASWAIKSVEHLIGSVQEVLNLIWKCVAQAQGWQKRYSKDIDLCVNLYVISVDKTIDKKWFPLSSVNMCKITRTVELELRSEKSLAIQKPKPVKEKRRYKHEWPFKSSLRKQTSASKVVFALVHLESKSDPYESHACSL